MFKRKFAAIATAATLSVALVPTASAQTEETSSEDTIVGGIIAVLAVPVTLSSLGSSFIAPQCGLLDTRGC